MSLGQNDNAILKLLADEQLRKENADLAAENERLRKAGDAMYQAAMQDSTGIWLHPAFKAWKETK